MARPDVDELGEEPDVRFTLANERTYLAWIRTSLALIRGGLGASRLLYFHTDRRRCGAGQADRLPERGGAGRRRAAADRPRRRPRVHELPPLGGQPAGDAPRPAAAVRRPAARARTPPRRGGAAP